LTDINNSISEQQQQIQQLNHEISSKTDINRLTQQAIDDGYLSPTMQDGANP
jgi:cell division protein FtsL